MYDFVLMGVDESLNKLIEIVLQFCFCDSFSFFDHLVEGVIAAEFQDDIDVLGILEDVIKEKNIFMLEGFVDFDLSDKLNRR